MSKPKTLTRPELPELWLIRLCLAAALGISLFLAWNSLKGGGVPGCGPESGCDKVLASRWAYAFGLPVSLFAAPVYIALLLLVRSRNLQWSVVLPLACLVLAAALWFVGLQVFVLRAFCKFCMTAHAAGVLAALLLTRRAPLPVSRVALSLLGAAAAVAVIAVSQSFAPERAPKALVRSDITNAPPSQPPSTNAVAANKTTQLASNVPASLSVGTSLTTNASAPVAPKEPILFSLVDGVFTIDLSRVPVTRPMNAPKKVAKIFDYTCRHCRDLHHLLGEFRLQHSNELAVISLPLPLDSNCNPLVKRTPPDHVNACEYARLGLAVFQANPDKFEGYTDWIYLPPRPPELSAAREYAENLVGRTKLEEALQNPAVNEQIQKDVQIYTETYRRAHTGQLPQLYFEHSASIGSINSREQLDKVMADNLGFAATPKP